MKAVGAVQAVEREAAACDDIARHLEVIEGVVVEEGDEIAIAQEDRRQSEGGDEARGDRYREGAVGHHGQQGRIAGRM